MDVNAGLKRVYVVLAAIWALLWLVMTVATYSEGSLSSEPVAVFVLLGLIFASPLVYFALVGLTKVVLWVVAGFKNEQPR